MPNVVFVAPFFLPATVRIIERVAELEGVRCAIVSQDRADRLPGRVRGLLVDFERVGDALSSADLCRAVKDLGRRQGPIDRVFGALEQVQVLLAEVRTELGVAGLGARRRGSLVQSSSSTACRARAWLNPNP
jgi:hypothetical protein